ncbi:putative membrane protein [Streptococcus pneumoniae GA13637]|nr:putative membrane protein [Streptococcus pneumoniae GA13637]EHZ75999.1 putative membrane protein [Streptococcus pneumoniae 8190-05]
MQKLDTMRFIVGIFAPFLLKLSFCPASVFGVAKKIMSCGEYL